MNTKDNSKNSISSSSHQSAHQASQNMTRAPQSMTPTRMNDYKSPMSGSKGDFSKFSQSKQSLFPSSLNNNTQQSNSNSSLSGSSSNISKLKSDNFISKFINAGHK